MTGDGPELEAIDRNNLGNMVYKQIAEALMRGRFQPNARLTIRELAVSLGTSVTPVRDAILRLIQDEALVQIRPREVRVPILSSARYQEIRDIRLRLEGLAARQAALTADQTDIRTLREIVARNEAAFREERWHDALELNQMFHSAFANIAGMPILSGVLNRLWLQMGPLLADAYRYGGRLMVDTHPLIVDAVADRDPERAERMMIKDISEAGDLLLKRIDILSAGTEAQLRKKA